MEPIKELIFKKTANPFVNSGIIGLHRMSQRFLERKRVDFPSIQVSDLTDNRLNILADTEEELLSYLEEVYYFMGNEYYDTYTTKQEDASENVFFEEREGKLIPHRFPKMNTYGLTHLFTNNAQGVTTKDSNSYKFVILKKEKPEYASFIEEYFKESGLKLLKKVYLNERYTKATRLEINKKYLVEGSEICPLTGESFKALVEAKNVSPFFSGLSNFNTFLSSTEKKISWKALFLIRFAPVVCFYSYHNSYETLICHLFESNTLENLNVLYSGEMYVTRDELERTNYLVNIQLSKFTYSRKDAEALVIDTAKDAVWPSEIAFMLIHTFYRSHLSSQITSGEDDILDFFKEAPILKKPITLITFRADKFASTLRPSFYEEYNQIKFVLSLIHLMETGKEGKHISLAELWNSLRFNSPRAKTLKRQNLQKGRAFERRIRADVLESVMNARSILSVMEKFYYDIFNYLLAGEQSGFRNYKTLFDFLTIYENIINMELDNDLQEYAINLGVSIGQGILRSGESGEDAKTLAKGGRKYIIDLRNSRTLEQFLQAIERIMFRYQIGVKRELLNRINDHNFKLIKRFTVISALNQLNPILSKQIQN